MNQNNRNDVNGWANRNTWLAWMAIAFSTETTWKRCRDYYNQGQYCNLIMVTMQRILLDGKELEKEGNIDWPAIYTTIDNRLKG